MWLWGEDRECKGQSNSMLTWLLMWMVWCSLLGLCFSVWPRQKWTQHRIVHQTLQHLLPKVHKNKKDKNNIIKYLYQINEVLQFDKNLSFFATVNQWKIEVYLITINHIFNRFTSVTTHLGFWKTIKKYKFCSPNIPSG